MRRRDLSDYAVLSVIWGVSFVLVLRVVEAFGWVGAVAFRALIAGAVLMLSPRSPGAAWTSAWGGGRSRSWARPRWRASSRAVVRDAPDRYRDGSHLRRNDPVVLHGDRAAWGLEHISKVGRAGLGLGLAGIVLLVGFPAVPVTAAFVIGCCGSLLSAVSAAFGSNYARARLQSVGSWEVTIGAFLFAGLMTLPLLVFVPVPTVPRLVDFGYLIVLSAIMSALAYVLYFRLVADLGATRAISVEFVVTAIAVLLGALVLDEKLSVAQLVGGVVILVGCALVLDLVPGRAVTAAEPSQET